MEHIRTTASRQNAALPSTQGEHYRRGASVQATGERLQGVKFRAQGFESAGAANRVPQEWRVHYQMSEGGMATLHLGTVKWDSGDIEVIALKKMLHGNLVAPNSPGSILREAQVGAYLNHPNVVPILQMCEVEGEHYLAMEYLVGATLADLLTAGDPLPVGIAVAIAGDVLSGLQAVHTATDASNRPLRMIHRDVSPANILVGDDGTARLIDFGLAKTSLSEPTGCGIVPGKVGYLAPEQLLGRPLEAQVDLFTMGIVLWEALTGRRLFPADNPVEHMLDFLTSEPPSAASINPLVPKEVDQVIELALASEPEKRFESAEAFMKSLFDGHDPSSPLEVSAYLERHAGIALHIQRSLVHGLQASNDQSSTDSAVQQVASEKLEVPNQSQMNVAERDLQVPQQAQSGGRRQTAIASVAPPATGGGRDEAMDNDPTIVASTKAGRAQLMRMQAANNKAAEPEPGKPSSRNSMAPEPAQSGAAAKEERSSEAPAFSDDAPRSSAPSINPRQSNPEGRASKAPRRGKATMGDRWAALWRRRLMLAWMLPLFTMGPGLLVYSMLGLAESRVSADEGAESTDEGSEQAVEPPQQAAEALTASSNVAGSENPVLEVRGPGKVAESVDMALGDETALVATADNTRSRRELARRARLRRDRGRAARQERAQEVPTPRARRRVAQGASPRGSRAQARKNKSCDPAFYYDERGIKRIKLHCL